LDASSRVDLYNHAYGNYVSDVYQQVRLETYGRDFGQTSWVTEQESGDIPRLLALTGDSSVLEIGCGSGVYAIHLAESVGSQIIGVDNNSAGIANAQQLTLARGLGSRASFAQVDVSKNLPYASESFHAVFANDVLCHLPSRLSVLHEMFRVLKPGGMMLFSDALVLGGMVSHEELATRSCIGFYVFSPVGENERLISTAGFHLLSATDTTAAAATIARRWHDARHNRKQELLAAEGDAFEGLQRFLDCTRALTEERRLLRFVYLAQKQCAG
jgi:SAM-dependent methyltransferase